MSFDIEAELMLLPYDKLSPYGFVSGGVLASNYFKKVYPKIEYGLGLEYLLSEKVGIHAVGGYNMVFSDEVDEIKAGKRDDHYLRFGVGLNLYLFNKRKAKNKKNESEVDAIKNK
jgi:curli production assembly/transport component CsgG